MRKATITLLAVVAVLVIFEASALAYNTGPVTPVPETGSTALLLLLGLGGLGLVAKRLRK